MATTTLPNAATLDKVYPGWRDLVTKGTVSKFINAKVSGSLTTQIFGLSSKFGSAVSATPGLQQVILDSPYPNFATSMALSNEHYVEASADGCFGTLRRAQLVKPQPIMIGLESYTIDGYDSLNATNILISEGWKHNGYWSNGTWSDVPSANAEKWDKMRSESYAKFVLTAPANSQAYATRVGTLAPALRKLGYAIDNDLPILCVGGNFNGQAADNANHDRSGMLTQYGRTTASAQQGFDLPGRKLVWVFVKNNSTTGYYGSYTYALGIYVKDDGSKWVPCFYRNLRNYKGGNVWLHHGYDGRYYTTIERKSMTGPWNSSNGVALSRIFGSSITLDGQEYITGTINDGWEQNGPIITDRVLGSDKTRLINFTPLLGIPGAINYSFLGSVVAGDEVEYLVDGVEVTYTEFAIDSRVFLANLDFGWYELYYKTGFDVYTPRSSNIQKNTLDSWAEIKDYQITLAQTATSYTLTQQMINALPAYQAYAKARKKACKDNDFMSLSFDGKSTYQAILDKAKPRSTFMQLLSDAAITDFSVSFKTMVSVAVVEGVATGTMADGTVVPISSDDYCQYVLSGGSRVTAVESALVIDSLTLSTIIAENREVPNMNQKPSTFTGDGSEDFTTNRYSQTINGYPLYSALNPTQRTYLQMTNISQYDSMGLPLIRVIQSLSADND